MKTPSTFLLATLGCASLLAYFGCAKDNGGVTGDHNVVIETDRLVLPGTTISAADQVAMNKVLKKFDSSLYKVELYDKGVLKRTQGSLSDLGLSGKLASQIAAFREKLGASQYVMAGARGSIVHKPPDQTVALVNALKPIFEKYSPRPITR